MSRNIVRNAAFLCWVLFIGSPALARASQLTGTVRDVCGRVIPGTAVTVESLSGMTFRTFTDGEGRYVFATMSPGSWTVRFEIAGYQKQQENIVLVDGSASVTQNVRVARDFTLKTTVTVGDGDPSLRYHQYSVHGTVTGRGDEPISGAIVTFSDVGSTHPVLVTDRCTTDELGRYDLSEASATPARWILSVEADGYARYTRADVEPNPDDIRTIEIHLQAR